MAPKFGSTNSISNSSEIWIEIQIFLQFCVTLMLYIEVMCVNFFNFDNLRIIIQSSDLIWGTKFCAPSLLLHPLIFSSFKLLSIASYGGELLFYSSSPWSGVSNHLSSFSILLPLNFKKQRTPLMKKIQGQQAPHGATSCGIKSTLI